MVGYLTSMYEALGSIPQKRKREKKKKGNLEIAIIFVYQRGQSCNTFFGSVFTFSVTNAYFIRQKHFDDILRAKAW